MMSKNTTTRRTSNWIGVTIVGKWNKKSYTIKKMVGYGANGTVYLAYCQGREVALKMSQDSMSISSEVNVLKKLRKVQGTVLGPLLYDIDDAIHPVTKEINHFYSMEYLDGMNYLKFVEMNCTEWAGILLLQLLKQLEQIHREGWAFGDLKCENLMVTGHPPKLRWFDVGGFTQFGRSINEYTEFYDRGYWGIGDRKACVSYDLFSAAMIYIHSFYPIRFDKRGNGRQTILDKIKKHPKLRDFEYVMCKVMDGKYRSAREMYDDVSQMMDLQKKVSYKMTTSTITRNKQPKPPGMKAKKQIKGKFSKTYFFLETTALVVSIIVSYVLYLINKVL